jgi:peptidoglycan/LPS O-acetylase OafA/YrhL
VTGQRRQLQAVGTPRTGGAADRVVAESVYRPYLDGLRAVAVYLVVLFHAGLARFSGGYVGVDVFFVLSGFLVTQLLVRDLSGGGSIRFGRFYARRFRRLLPAAFATLIVTALVFAAVTPSEALASFGSFKAAFLYSANWYFIRQSTDYFGGAVATNPVLQFWSLAVEEQFYLLWPLALAAIFWMAGRLPRRQLLFVRLTVAAGALASLLWALHLRTGDPNRAYFGTDARAYQLLAGASIALVPGLVSSLGRFRRSVHVAVPVAVGSLLVLASSLWGLDAIVRGMAVVVVAGVAIVALECADGGVVKRVLSSDLFVYLGKISYGTYLWHWPVIILATEVLHLSSGAMAWFACLVATALASLSFQLLERPVRESRLMDSHRLVVIGAGLAISVVSALVVIPAIIDSGSASGAAPQASTAEKFTPVPSWINTAQIYFEGFGSRRDNGMTGKTVSCLDAEPDQCTVVHGTGGHLLLMGDSNAQMMIPAFTKIAEENNLTLSLEVADGCPWQRGLYALTKGIRDRCRAKKEDAYNRVIPALDPDLIILMNAGDSTDKGPSDPNKKPLDRATQEATVKSLDELAVGDRNIVIIEPNPTPPPGVNPLSCLETAKALEDCRYIADTSPSWYELLTRKRADASDHIWSSDFDRLVCPYLPICDPVVGGIVVKWDGQHLATRFSKSLAGPIATYLRANRLI